MKISFFFHVYVTVFVFGVEYMCIYLGTIHPYAYIVDVCTEREIQAIIHSVVAYGTLFTD